MRYWKYQGNAVRVQSRRKVKDKKRAAGKKTKERGRGEGRRRGI